MPSVPASASNLVVSEFSYNPEGSRNAAEAPYGSSDFEFIELLNISAQPVDLYKVTLAGAVDFVIAQAVQERLLPPEMLERITLLRRSLMSMKPVEAMERLLKKLSEFETNDEFLGSF